MISPHMILFPKTEGAPSRARPLTRDYFFLLSKSRITNYEYSSGKSSEFIFAFFTATYEIFAPFTPLTRFFPNRDDPLQQPNIKQNFGQYIQGDRNIIPNCPFGTAQKPRRCRLIMFLQNISRKDLPREFIQLVQASLHVVHEDDSIFKRDDCVRRYLRPEKFPPQQRRQPPGLNRVPHIPPQHHHRPRPINPPLPLLLPRHLRNRSLLHRIRILNLPVPHPCRVFRDRACPELVEGAGFLISPVPLCALCGEFRTPRKRMRRQILNPLV